MSEKDQAVPKSSDGDMRCKAMNTIRVCITSEGFIPIPESVRKELDLKPAQMVMLHTEPGRLIVEKPSRQQVIAELECLCNELRSGEPLEQIWAEIEAGREEER
jgi:antitoxin component of MazEF toxin-antitoxin module